MTEIAIEKEEIKMELSDKCLEVFEKWYAEEFEKRNLPYKAGFDISDDSIKYGVYVDFFDSVGIEISMIKSIRNSKEKFLFCIDTPSTPHHYKKYHASRQEARKAAIEKANEIYNNQ